MAQEETLAVEGGPPARTLSHKEAPRTGLDELMEIAGLWGFRAGSDKEIRAVLEKHWEGIPPHLFRYYHPKGRSKTQEFEQEFARMFSVPYALAVNSGTSALIAACVACGVGPGTEVIIPAHTFFATASAVVVAKGIPVIVEADDSLMMDPAEVEKHLSSRTAAIIVVHMKGMPADMDAILRIAARRNVRVIEDVAQAAGGSYRGRKLGTLGDVGCFSLDYYKVIQSGEGGVMAFSNEWLYTRAQSYHDTAACWRPDRFARERKKGELFAGENYRMSELQAAMALAQLRKLEGFVSDQVRNYRRITAALDLPEGVRPLKDNDPDGGCRTTLGILWPSRDSAVAARTALEAEGVSSGTHDTEVRDWHVYRHWDHVLEKKSATEEGCPYTCPYFKGTLPAYSPEMCPRTLDLLSRTVFIPTAGSMTDEECRQIAAGISKVARILIERFRAGQPLLRTGRNP